MAETIKFEGSTGNPHCVACEEMLADVLDETVSAADQVWFDRHLAGCAACSGMLADARRGAAWLELLKMPRPEPTAMLLERILAKTSGKAAQSRMEMQQPAIAGEALPALNVLAPAAPVALPVSVIARSNVLAFRSRLPKAPLFSRGYFEPRLAMTAAMAFFSVALTLNLAGVHLGQVQAADLKLLNLKKNYYEATARAVRYYDNLRVVRVLESRVDDLRESSGNDSRDDRRDDRPVGQPEVKPEAKPEPKQERLERSPDGGKDQKALPVGPGMSRREAPMGTSLYMLTDDKAWRNVMVVGNNTKWGVA